MLSGAPGLASFVHEGRKDGSETMQALSNTRIIEP